MDNYKDKLIRLPLFNEIGASELEVVLRCIGGFIKSYGAGSYIILDGDSVECVGIVISGAVRMIKEDIWGEKAILAFIGQSQVFGETYVFSESNRSNVSFIAAESSEILFLPFKRALHSCAKHCAYHRRLVDNMVSQLANKNLQLTEKLEITSKKSLRAKILTYLSQQSQQSGSKYFTVQHGRVEMADYLCADRSALTRELTRMKADGILDYNNKTFRLLEKADSAKNR